jgi:membrane-associated protease RseP (regulator of RpoE activity)
LIDLTLSQLVMRGCALLFFVSLHGFAMAAAASALGDQGPRRDGRLTFNPFAHLDLLGGAVALVFSVGWAKWLAIDPRELRHGRLDLLLIPIAGLAAILLGATVLRLARPLLLPLLPFTPAASSYALIQTTIGLGMNSAVLGLLPIPPLAGGHLVVALFPQLADVVPRFELALGLMLGLLIATGVLTRPLGPVVELLLRILP